MNKTIFLEKIKTYGTLIHDRHININDLVADIKEFTNIENLDINVNEIADTVAISMLQEILFVIKDDTLSDFEMVDRIVTIFEDKNIQTGSCHDF